MAIMPVHQFSILAGASGCGKTTLILQAWSEHEGKRDFPLQFDPSITHAAMIVADRTCSEVQSRMDYLGIRNMELYGLINDCTLDPKIIRIPPVLWGEVISRLKSNYQLLIVDPIAPFMEGNLIDYKSVAISLIRFNRYAISHNLTIVGIHHTAKMRKDNMFLRPQDRISGSGAFPGYSSTQCMMVEGLETEGKEYDDFVIVPHMSAKEEYQLVRRSDGYFALLTNHANVKALELLSAEKVVKVNELHSFMIKLGLTDVQVRAWMEGNAHFHVKNGYVVLNEG